MEFGLAFFSPDFRPAVWPVFFGKPDRVCGFFRKSRPGYGWFWEKCDTTGWFEVRGVSFLTGRLKNFGHG